jgi:hypothetical protein
METYRGQLFPNLFTILAGVPATGKSISVGLARNLWATVKGLRLGPDNPTKASFLDELELANRTSLDGEGHLTIYSAMSVPCFEFGVLIQKNDTAFLNDLTHIFDNPMAYTAPRRSSKSLNIPKPTINILAGVTPDYLGDVLPETAWGQGFTSRLIFIYGTHLAPDGRDVFVRKADTDMSELAGRLDDIFNDLKGEFWWKEDARHEFHAWYRGGKKPEPDYGRLAHYNSRRDSHVLKLAMISAVAAEHELTVHKSDFDRALSWMIEAEKVMPDVFRAMAQKSDQQLIADLHYHIYSMYSRTATDGRKPIRERELWKFFENRAPSERIEHLIGLAVKSGRLQMTLPGEYIPKALDGVTEV